MTTTAPGKKFVFRAVNSSSSVSSQDSPSSSTSSSAAAGSPTKAATMPARAKLVFKPLSSSSVTGHQRLPSSVIRHAQSMTAMRRSASLQSEDGDEPESKAEKGRQAAASATLASPPNDQFARSRTMGPAARQSFKWKHNQFSTHSLASQKSTSRLSLADSASAAAAVEANQPESMVFHRTTSDVEVHKQFSNVPYCPRCKTYVEQLVDPDQRVYEGFLDKRKPSVLIAWRQRWFVLSGNHVAYYEDPEDLGHSLPKGVMHLDHTVVTDPNPDELVFNVDIDGTTYKLRAPSEAEKKTWMRLFKENDQHFQDASNGDTIYDPDSDEYVPLDDFTLADVDGWVSVNGDDRYWAVKSGQYMALYKSEDDVFKNRAVKVVLVTNTTYDQSSKAFNVKNDKQPLTFHVSKSKTINDWVEALCPKNSDSDSDD